MRERKKRAFPSHLIQYVPSLTTSDLSDVVHQLANPIGVVGQRTPWNVTVIPSMPAVHSNPWTVAGSSSSSATSLNATGLLRSKDLSGAGNTMTTTTAVSGGVYPGVNPSSFGDPAAAVNAFVGEHPTFGAFWRQQFTVNVHDCFEQGFCPNFL